MQAKDFCKLIEERKEELFELLSNLVKINSENYGNGGNEKDCATYIYNLCKEMGFEADMYSPMEIEGFGTHPDYMEGHNLENRYNTVARYKGLEDIDEVMMYERTVPDEYINEEGNGVTESFKEWCRPLLGEALPKMISFN